MTALEAGAALSIRLADLLLHTNPAAVGTGLRYRPVPGGEITRRVTQAAPEGLASLGTPLGQHTLGALGALESHGYGAGAFALEIRGAGQELAKLTGLDDHGGTAEVTLLVRGAIRN